MYIYIPDLFVRIRFPIARDIESSLIFRSFYRGNTTIRSPSDTIY